MHGFRPAHHLRRGLFSNPPHFRHSKHSTTHIFRMHRFQLVLCFSQIDRACCRTSKCTFLHFFYTFGQFDALQPICIECSGFDFPESGRHNDLFKISVPKGILPHTRHRLRKLKSRMLLGILKRSVECICSDRFEFRRQGELLQLLQPPNAKSGIFVILSFSFTSSKA